MTEELPLTAGALELLCRRAETRLKQMQSTMGGSRYLPIHTALLVLAEELLHYQKEHQGLKP